MFGIGAGEFILILIVGLIVFGPSKLPEFGRSLGKLIREFRKAQATISASLNDLDDPPTNTTTVATPTTTAQSTTNVAQTTTAADQATNTVATATTQAQASSAQADKVNIVKPTNAITTAKANIEPSSDKVEVKVDSTKVAANVTVDEPANNSNLSTEQLTRLIESNPVKVDTSNFITKEAPAK